VKKALLCILAVVTLHTSLLLSQDISGDWQGIVGGPPGGLRTILRITKSNGGWSAQMFDIDQIPDPIPVSSITLDGTDLKYSIDLLHGSYTGKLSVDGSSISGTWNQGQSFPLNFTRATKETAWSTDPSPHTVKLILVEKDVKLEVLDWGGSGRPLILLAGLGDTAHIFDHFAPKLTSSYHVYGITRRGYGASSAPVPANDNYSADQLGDDVLAVIAALNLNRPILAGHSMAGEELSSIGSRHPEKVAGLIYLDALSAYSFYDRPKGNLIIDADDLLKKLGQLVSNTTPREQKATVEELLHSSLPQIERDLKQRYEELGKTPEPANGSVPPATMPEMPAVDKAILMGMQKYTEIKVPVLAIVAFPHDLDPNSKEDPAARVTAEANESAFLKAFEAGVPSAHVVRLAHADHYVFQSNEPDVLREIARFTASLP